MLDVEGSVDDIEPGVSGDDADISSSDGIAGFCGAGSGAIRAGGFISGGHWRVGRGSPGRILVETPTKHGDLRKGIASPEVTGSGPGGLFAGKDFRSAYAPGTTLDGTGQRVGLLQFDGYNGRDITNYENDVGATNRVPLANVLIDGFGGSAGSGNDEVCLDIEMSMSMAPHLTQIILYEGNPSKFAFNPVDVVTKMANDNLARNWSSSWTWSSSPDATIDAAFVQMATQGQTYFQAAGDDDAYTGSQPLDNSGQVNSPAGDTNLTVVGGTALVMNGTGASCASESVWNQNSTNKNVGTGGGVSIDIHYFRRGRRG